MVSQLVISSVQILMRPPITRSRTHSYDFRAAAPIFNDSEALTVTHRIAQSLIHASDDDVVRSHDAKELRDAVV